MAFSTYVASYIDDGAGNVSVVVRRGGTISGGTVVTQSASENVARLLNDQFASAARVMKNDRASGN